MSIKGYGGANIGKLLKHEEKRYSYDSRLEGIIIESTANALDYQVANASNIHIDTKQVSKWEVILSITDDGKGMVNWEKFKQFFVFGSDSKEQTTGDIGFVGVGTHLYIIEDDSYECIETRSDNGFHHKVRWSFDKVKNDTKYEEIFTDMYLTKPGTRIEIHIRKKEDMERALNDEYLNDIIRRNWNPVLLGFYGDKHILVNGKEVEPFCPDEEEHMIREFKINGEKYKTLYYKTKETLPTDWQGIFIVTGKKIITNVSDYFRHYPDERVRDYVYGYVIADGLISITKTGKDGYMTRTTLWKTFHNQSAKKWKKFLDRIGCSITVEKNKKLVEYNTKLNTLLTNPRWKHYKKLFNKPGVAPAKRKCPVCDSEEYHTWDKDNQYYECENGHLFKKKYTWVKKGHTPVTTPTVKKSVFGINADEIEISQPLESFVNGATRQILINKNISTYKDAQRSKKAQEIHYKRCLASAMVEEMIKQSLITETEAKQDFLELYEAL